MNKERGEREAAKELRQSQEWKRKALSNKMMPGHTCQPEPSRDRMAGLVLTGGAGGSSSHWLSHTCSYAGGSTNLNQTETSDLGFIWIGIFIYPGNNFFEVGWFYSKKGPKLSYLGDCLNLSFLGLPILTPLSPLALRFFIPPSLFFLGVSAHSSGLGP